MTESRRSMLTLAILLGLAYAAGAVGSVFTARSVGTWYQDLAKPSWTPPGWVFGPVWTLLYTMMGLAAWLVWLRGTSARTAEGPLAAWGVQLVLNAVWSALFFGLRRPDLALAELAALWCVVLATTVLFWCRSRAAGWLMVPYVLWTTFAGALNFAIWRLNA